MKTKLCAIILLVALLAECGEPLPAEQPATISNYDYTFCGYCGGWFVWVDSTTWYRANVSEAYGADNTKVLIRFETDQRPGFKEGRWINIKSIRKQ